MSLAHTIIGNRFGRLVIQQTGATSETVLALCDCGTLKEFQTSNVVLGKTKSCGCIQHDKAKHGLVKNRHIPTFRSWMCMMKRCYYKKDKSFIRYGGRGIKVCEKWHRFEGFSADMDKRPDGTTLDRKNSNLDYSKDNCRWGTPSTQQNNRRNNTVIEINGETKTVRQWSRVFGINHQTIHERLKRGWDVTRAITEKPHA